ncbi:hypothetical protein ACJJTC_005818 [Scirpophaga incertulas]
MTLLLQTLTLSLISAVSANEQTCHWKCPVEGGTMTCGFNFRASTYKIFPSKCAMERFRDCHGAELVETPLVYCIKDQSKSSRRMYDESCPVFCPSHYRPVCGANKFRSYVYRTFNNGCYLDMINCRGDEDFSAYTEVPLEFCQNHAMKNIFKERIVISNIKNNGDYN